MKAALLALALLPAAAYADASADKALVKANCIVADQTTGRPLAIESATLEEVQVDVTLLTTARGYTYKIGRTTAGSAEDHDHLLSLSIEKHGRIIAQTGVTIEPGKSFNVMLTANPQKETITCAGK